MTENLAPAAAAPVAKIAIRAEVSDLVRGSLFPKNDVGRASVDFYRAVLASVGIDDPDSLSFAETVEVTRRLYAPSADFRKDSREVARIEREALAAEAKAKRDDERAKRAEEEIAKIEKRLAALRGK